MGGAQREGRCLDGPVIGLEHRSPAHEGVTDERGERLAKRHESLSLRALRAAGRTPEEVRGLLTTGAPPV